MDLDAMRSADALAALAARGISPSAQLVFLHLSSAVGGGTENPSFAWLSGRTGCSEQTVRRALRELVDAGLLLQTRQGRGNRYQFGSNFGGQIGSHSDHSRQIGSHFGHQNGNPLEEEKEEKNVCTHTSSLSPGPAPTIPRETAAEYIHLKASENGALAAYLWRAWRDGELQIGDLEKLREAAAAKARAQVAAAMEAPMTFAEQHKEAAESESLARSKWSSLPPSLRAAVAHEHGWDVSNPPLQSSCNHFKLNKFIEQNLAATAQVGSCDL